MCNPWPALVEDNQKEQLDAEESHVQVTDTIPEALSVAARSDSLLAAGQSQVLLHLPACQLQNTLGMHYHC